MIDAPMPIPYCTRRLVMIAEEGREDVGFVLFLTTP